jgi:DNA polymerase III epsilon subunit family exonuclease
MTNFKKNTFVVLDLETTGLSARYGDRIVEIGALKVRGLEVVDRFHSLVDPQRPISYGAFLVNGISAEMVKGAPRAAEVLPRLMKFIGKAYVIGHNLRFDIGFLAQELALLGQTLDDDLKQLDTIRIARRLLPEAGRYSLAHLACYLGIETLQSHRAMADAELTFAVFRELLAIADRKDICDIEQLSCLCGGKTVVDERHLEKCFLLIQNAIASSQALRMTYLSPRTSALTQRTVQPVKITGSGFRAQLVGYCHLRKEERAFLLKRIVALMPIA